MTEEKQIEEMAKIIGDADQRCYEINDCNDCPFHYMELGLCKEKFLAADLYSAGYRKTSEIAREIFEGIEKLVYQKETPITAMALLEMPQYKKFKRKHEEN